MYRADVMMLGLGAEVLKRDFERLALVCGEPHRLAHPGVLERILVNLHAHDVWKNPADGDWQRPCTIITTDANELVAKVHDRMPAILAPDHYAAWLGEETAGPELIKAMLRPSPAERLAMWPVDRRIGNVKNEAPELAEPLALTG